MLFGHSMESRRGDGAQLVESAISLPLLIAMFSLILSIGWQGFQRSAFDFAVEQIPYYLDDSIIAEAKDANIGKANNNLITTAVWIEGENVNNAIQSAVQRGAKDGIVGALLATLGDDSQFVVKNARLRCYQSQVTENLDENSCKTYVDPGGTAGAGDLGLSMAQYTTDVVEIEAILYYNTPFLMDIDFAFFNGNGKTGTGSISKASASDEKAGDSIGESGSTSTYKVNFYRKYVSKKRAEIS